MRQLSTKRLVISQLEVADAESYLEFLTDNKEAFRRSEPSRSEDYYRLESVRQLLQSIQVDAAKDRGYRFILRYHGDIKIIGSVGISNIVRGAFQAAHLGYKLSQSEWKQGGMKEALHELVPFAFKEFNFHRLMANYESWNVASERLLTGLGFQSEGKARDYLFLDGAWRDHILTSLINEKHE